MKNTTNPNKAAGKKRRKLKGSRRLKGHFGDNLPSDVQFILLAIILHNYGCSSHDYIRLAPLSVNRLITQQFPGSEIPDGTLYTTLQRMEKRNWITRGCHDYVITESGSHAFQNALAYHKSLAEVGSNFHKKFVDNNDPDS